MKGKKLISLAVAGSCIFSSALAAEVTQFDQSSSALVENLEASKLYITDRRELADGLAGGVLVAQEGAGLLTIDPDNLTDQEKALIEEADSLYILGGQDRVGQDFESLENFAGRYAGPTRYDTAVSLAQELGTDRDLVIVNGLNYVDAITSSPMAALEGRNIILVEKDSLPQASLDYLQAYGQGKDILFVGGEDSICRANKEAILDLVDSQVDPDQVTLAGKNRYETSLQIAKRAPQGSNAVMASGEDMEMAINSINLYAKAPVCLVANASNHEEILASYKEDHLPAALYTLGQPEDWLAKAGPVEEKASDQEDQGQVDSQDQPSDVENPTGQEVQEEQVPEEPSQADQGEEGLAEDQVDEASLAGQTQAPVEETQAEAPAEEAQAEAPAEKAQPANPAQPFIDEAHKFIGARYSQSLRNSPGYADCSSLVNRSLINSGLTTDKRNLTSGSIFSDPRFRRISFNELRPGDVLHSPGHLAIFIGDGKVLEAKDWGVPAGYGSYAYRNWDAAFRINGI